MPPQLWAAAWTVPSEPLVSLAHAHYSCRHAQAIPSKHNQSPDDMGWKYLPKEQRELADDVGDVEDSRKPRILAARQFQVLLHAGNLSVANVTTIEERQHI